MIVELGTEGDYTRAVQRIVGAQADGKCGPLSVAAIKIWQARRGVEADGVFGPLSRAAVEPGDMIKPYEGLRLQAYDDADGATIKRVGNEWRRADGSLCHRYPTIGWGRRLWPGQWIETCTKAEADMWLLQFLKSQLDSVVARHVPADVDPAQKAAVYSLGYNGGPGAIVKLADAGFTEDFWTNGPYIYSAGVLEHGLVMRRREEWAVWSAAA